MSCRELHNDFKEDSLDVSEESLVRDCPKSEWQLVAHPFKNRGISSLRQISDIKQLKELGLPQNALLGECVLTKYIFTSGVRL